MYERVLNTSLKKNSDFFEFLLKYETALDFLPLENIYPISISH